MPDWRAAATPERSTLVVIVTINNFVVSRLSESIRSPNGKRTQTKWSSWASAHENKYGNSAPTEPSRTRGTFPLLLLLLRHLPRLLFTSMLDDFVFFYVIAMIIWHWLFYISNRKKISCESYLIRETAYGHCVCVREIKERNKTKWKRKIKSKLSRGAFGGLFRLEIGWKQLISWHRDGLLNSTWQQSTEMETDQWRWRWRQRRHFRRRIIRLQSKAMAAETVITDVFEIQYWHPFDIWINFGLALEHLSKRSKCRPEINGRRHFKLRDELCIWIE